MTRMLVSVKNVAEALAAAGAGADFIDLKDPAAGALGGLPTGLIREIVAALRGAGEPALTSATIGDVAPSQRAEILARVTGVAACGVDYVKVGIEPGRDSAALLGALARCGATVVPVLIADDAIELALVREALSHDAFPALMVDTQDKLGGSLLARRSAAELHRFIDTVRAHGVLCGLAGALRVADLPGVAALAPDFAGFRSAVCAADRAGALDASRVREIKRALSLRPDGDSARAFNVGLTNHLGSTT